MLQFKLFNRIIHSFGSMCQTKILLPWPNRNKSRRDRLLTVLLVNLEQNRSYSCLFLVKVYHLLLLANKTSIFKTYSPVQDKARFWRIFNSRLWHQGNHKRSPKDLFHLFGPFFVVEVTDLYILITYSLSIIFSIIYYFTHT